MSNQLGEGIIVGPGRFAFLNIYKMREGDNGPYYQATLALPKSQTEAFQALCSKLAKEKFGSFDGLKFPIKAAQKTYNGLKEGSLKRGKDFDEAKWGFLNDPNMVTIEFKAYEGHQPEAVDRNADPILDQAQVYAGMTGYVDAWVKTFEKGGNRGITCMFNTVMKVEDGDKLGGGKRSAKEAFAGVTSQATNEDLTGGGAIPL
jgi:hypothetical protein